MPFPISTIILGKLNKHLYILVILSIYSSCLSSHSIHSTCTLTLTLTHFNTSTTLYNRIVHALFLEHACFQNTPRSQRSSYKPGGAGKSLWMSPSPAGDDWSDVWSANLSVSNLPANQPSRSRPSRFKHPRCPESLPLFLLRPFQLISNVTSGSGCTCVFVYFSISLCVRLHECLCAQ